jgi:predicted nucleic acid-binding protein
MTVFADTFFYLALFNTRDAYHGRVLDFVAHFTGGVVTTQWVLTEVANACAGIPARRALRARFGVLDADPGTRIVPASAELFERGLWLYDARPDKGWSLTDCLSFVVMADEGLTDALTGDRHFEQAGFRTLLAASSP